MSTKKENLSSKVTQLELNDSIELSYRTSNGDRIEPANEFIYEITKYIIYRKEHRVEVENSMFVKSDKLLKSKSHISNKKEPVAEFYSISLIGAPKEFIVKNNLPFYQLLKKDKLCQKKRK